MVIYKYNVQIEGTECAKIISFSKKRTQKDIIRKFNTLYLKGEHGHNNTYVITLKIVTIFQ